MTKKQRDNYRFHNNAFGKKARLHYIYENRIKKLYNISFGNYLNFTNKNSCDICCISKSSKIRLNIDHCHQTGIYRGALCTSCNVALGHFRDNKEIMKRAVSYIELNEEIQNDPELLKVLQGKIINE